METIQTAITGEEGNIELDTPVGALAAFYRAFNGRDLALMKQVWLVGDEVTMANPIGGIRRGWPEIEAGYRKLFQGAARVYVEFYDYTLQCEAGFALAMGRERGTCVLPAARIDLAIRTSRLFVLRQGRWRQLHHHGSMDDGAMLMAYQQAIWGK